MPNASSFTGVAHATSLAGLKHNKTYKVEIRTTTWCLDPRFFLTCTIPCLCYGKSRMNLVRLMEN